MGFHRPLIDLHFGAVDRLAHAECLVGHQPLRSVIGHDHAIFKPLRQRSGDPVGHRRDEIDPQRAQPRRQHRHRQDDPTAKPEFFSHHPHQVAVRHHVGAADLKRSARRLGQAIATGWHSVVTHLGVTMIGSRSTR